MVGVGGWVDWVGRWAWVLAAGCGLGVAWVLVKDLGVDGNGVLFWVMVVGGLAWMGEELWSVGKEVGFGVGAVALEVFLGGARGAAGKWWETTWRLMRMVLPALVAGVFLSGSLLGRPSGEGLIPGEWVRAAVGGEGLGAVGVSSVLGALMYFATLTEVPILEALMGSGMGKGPALALLLAGPAVSLPNLLASGRIVGWKRAGVYGALVVVGAVVAGWVYGQV